MYPVRMSQSSVDYQVEFVELEMKQNAKQIMTLGKDQLPLQDEIIKNIKGEIQQLESELVYKNGSRKARCSPSNCTKRNVYC